MSDWVLLAYVLILWVALCAYFVTSPPWLVRLWLQITRPIRWIEQQIRRRR